MAFLSSIFGLQMFGNFFIFVYKTLPRDWHIILNHNIYLTLTRIKCIYRYIGSQLPQHNRFAIKQVSTQLIRWFKRQLVIFAELCIDWPVSISAFWAFSHIMNTKPIKLFLLRMKIAREKKKKFTLIDEALLNFIIQAVHLQSLFSGIGTERNQKLLSKKISACFNYIRKITCNSEVPNFQYVS